MVKLKNTRSSSSAPVEFTPDEATGVMSLGKGMYRLSDGSEVKGKKKAIEAESSLPAPEGNADPEADAE